MSLLYKDEGVVDAALITCIEIFKTMPDIIKKCADEFQ